ncbi:conserved protein of unknown function [Moritella yayanosii]|uniref:DUF6843 domain-containing protein n=2 Tax=Moritella yayanosii TaxID=69539 RepID=A0A330LUS7_9GAMM|nr:conserved protein of unknown function [Moritella yayanosii]
MVACDETPPRDPEMYIIPDGYIGTFHIVYNVTNGQPKKMQDGFRVYEIPENGELKLLTDRYTTNLDDIPENTKNQSTIYGGSMGTSKYSFLPCVLESQTFIVGIKKDILDGVNNFELGDRAVTRTINCAGMEGNELYYPDLEP